MFLWETVNCNPIGHADVHQGGGVGYITGELDRVIPNRNTRKKRQTQNHDTDGEIINTTGQAMGMKR